MSRRHKTHQSLKSYKSWIILGYCLALCVLVAAFMIPTTFLSAESWQKKLGESVQQVLEEKNPGMWLLGDYVPIKSTFSQNAACFKIMATKSGVENYAVIMRVQTLYGPFAAVYIYSPLFGTSFVGFSSLHGKIADLLENSQKSNARILYWQKRIPDILKNSL